MVLQRWMGLLSERVYRGILFGASLVLAAYGVLLLGSAAESETAPGR